MSNATVLNIDYWPGQTLKLDLTVVDDAGDAVDLTGATTSDINYLIQESQYSSTNQIYKEIGSGITVTDAVNGTIQVVVGPTDGSNIVFVNQDLTYWHRLQVELSSEPDIAMHGDVTVKKAGTKVSNIEIGGDSTGTSPSAASSHQLAWELPVGTLNL